MFQPNHTTVTPEIPDPDAVSLIYTHYEMMSCSSVHVADYDVTQ